MKRLLALILCLTCLLGVLASCNDEPTDPVDTTPTAPTTNDTPTEPVDTTIYALHLAQYTIVYPKDASETVKTAATRLQSKITSYLTNGDTIAVITDDQTAKTGYEILIGETSRDASKAYYAEGTKAEFAVRNVDQTIVLAGYSDALTDQAVKYFEATYLSNVSESKIAVVENYTGTFEKSFMLSSSAKVVYQDETLASVADAAVETIKNATGLTLSKGLAATTYNADAVEIMIGSYDFKAIKDVKGSLWLDGYVVALRDNKIVVTATTADGYEKAIDALGAMLPAYMLEGTKDVVLTPGQSVREVAVSLLNNVPGASTAPSAVYPAGDGAYMAVFKGVKDTFFTEYVAALEAEGFTKYTTANFDGSTDKQKNSFATYISDTNSIDIGYHTRGYLGYGDSFGNGLMFVTVSPRDGLTLPKQSAPSYTPVDSAKYPTIVTQVGFDDIHPGQTSNCYIIRLADGTFIIHDSAYTAGVANEIYKILKKQAPDPNNIVISAWITSHPHADHMDGLVEFSQLYASDPTITVKQFVQNFADDSIATASEKANQNKVYGAIKCFGPKVEVVKAHAGNVLYYANVKFNVLYTQEEYVGFSDGWYYGNASSLVMQMVTEDGCKVIFGGDSPMMDMMLDNDGDDIAETPYTYGAIHKWYGSFIESDVMTYFHHGLGGGSSWAANAAIKPKIVLWPASWGKINGAGTQLINSSHAIYFNKLTDASSYNTFAEGVMHDTPNYNGVYGWFVADDNIHVVILKKDALDVIVYDTFAAFYAS